MNERIKKYCDLLSSLITPNTKPEDVNEQLTAATNTIEIDVPGSPGCFGLIRHTHKNSLPRCVCNHGI